MLVVVPSQAFRAVLGELAPLLAPAMHVAWATKGFEQGSLKLPHQVAREALGARRRIAVLSGPDVCARGRRGTAHRDDRRIAGCGVRAGAGARAVVGELPRLQLHRHHGGGDRRRREECAGGGGGAVRRSGLWRQHACRAHHARLEGDDPARAGARRAGRHLHGARGPGRPGAHLHRRSVAQPALRAAARRGPQPRKLRSRRSARRWRATRRRAPSMRSPRTREWRCPCAPWCTACCTRSCRRRMQCVP